MNSAMGMIRLADMINAVTYFIIDITDDHILIDPA